MGVDGEGICQIAVSCPGLVHCDDAGNCPEGSVCTIDTCCGNVCIPQQALCPPAGPILDIQEFNLLAPLDGPTTSGQ